VEGILHRFLALSKENKRAFLREIRDYIKAQDPEDSCTGLTYLSIHLEAILELVIAKHEKDKAII